MPENILCRVPVGDLVDPAKPYVSKSFFIPDYQRGYRWHTQQVEELLKDLWEFHTGAHALDAFYCLQPIVLKEHPAHWEVIDGQQRLTTILLLLNCLRQHLPVGSKAYQMNYQTRPSSPAFLEQPIADKQGENPDYHHIWQAHIAIGAWLGQHEEGTAAFLQTILERTEFLWFQVQDGSSGPEVFTRLNSGKIPLSAAELVRALLLKDMTEEATALSVAAQWDAVERELQDDRYWHFLQRRSPPEGARIGFVLDLFTDTHADEGDGYESFRKILVRQKTEGAMAVWERVKRLSQTLREWYEDRETFHLVGFLTATPAESADRDGTTLAALYEASQTMGKAAFLNKLKTIIAHRFEGVNLNTLDYKNRKARPLLLLFNLAWLLRKAEGTERFRFDAYHTENWDVEHIHAVRSRMPDTLRDQQDWLKALLGENLLAEDLREVVKAFLERKKSDGFKVLYDQIMIREEANDINDLSNLTLLDAKTNRSYKNAIFRLKRRKILEREREGQFIPVCTKYVFLKHFNDDADSLALWLPGDREAYRKTMAETLNRVFPTLFDA